MNAKPFGMIRWAGAWLVLLQCSLSLQGAVRPRLDLNGTWDFYPDVGDATLDTATIAPGKILVPGAWQAQGYGPPGGSIPSSVVGSDITPAEYLRHNLTARCLYVREFQLPRAWQGRCAFLCVRRVYRYADVTVNGTRVGDYEGFSSPFECDVTESLRFGESNRFVIGVDNRARKDRDTVGMANYFSNAGGFGGDVYLEARPADWIQDVFAMPRIAASQVRLRVTLRTVNSDWPPGMSVTAEVTPWNPAGQPIAAVGRIRQPLSTVATREQSFELPVTLAPLRLWSPDDPFLYLATVRLERDNRIVDEQKVRFGMREITADGTGLLLNGKPLYLAGYGDDTTYPLTGMMPWDKSVYLRQLQLMRSLGFNFVRHHSCTPHDAYFEAADEVGMLVQPEAGMAYVKFWPKAHGLFTKEWPQIIRAFRNHPSIWAWCTGNELFLNDLPERDSNSLSLNLSRPLTNGPLQTVAVEDNGVFGPPGQFPTRSFKQSNYYRDVEVMVAGQRHRLLGQAVTRRVFNDGPHELGLKFTSSRDGLVTRIRYLRVPEEQGSHIGRLWDSSGRELARVAFASETASGWQETILTQPVPIVANEIYLVSVNANTAYAATSGGSGFSRQDALEILEQAYQQAKELDPTRLVHASDGGTPQPWTDVVSSRGWEPFGPKPYLLHEYGNYTCSLPDFSLIPRLNGVIRPLTYERAQAYVKRHNLEAVYPRLYHSSLAMRADAQKQYLEAARVTDANAGYSFWLGIDFPESPEGCWDEGILNQLWEPKPGLTNGLTDITGSTVLVTTLGLESRSFYHDESKSVGLRLSHFGHQPLENARVLWRLKDGETLIQNGELPPFACGLGEVKSAGELVIPALGVDGPKFLTLECELRSEGQRVTKNAWELYAYPRISRETPLAGVFSEVGPLPGATALSTNDPLPPDLRVLITRDLKRERHGALLRDGNVSVLLLGTGGLKTIDKHADYFLNAYGGAFGGIIEDHPVFASIPHRGRLHLGLYQLIAGGGLLDAEAMPAALRDGSVVWGLGLTAWISTEKNLQRSALFCDVITDRDFHLVLCNLDILANKPESRYVLARTLDYLFSGKLGSSARRCASADLEALLR
ncbi:MAG: DUF4082 domain-containing protein [Verrucomicrobia bacterium]|nr:DUF4082 domain-containing protein [Verrucomicrobiota bacterium]